MRYNKPYVSLTHVHIHIGPAGAKGGKLSFSRVAVWRNETLANKLQDSNKRRGHQLNYRWERLTEKVQNSVLLQYSETIRHEVDCFLFGNTFHYALTLKKMYPQLFLTINIADHLKLDALTSLKSLNPSPGN